MTIPNGEIAYLGPPGTFCHDAANGLFSDGEQLLPMANIPAVLEAVNGGAANFGVVPIENSVHGEVTTTMDSLVFDFRHLYVAREIVVPVSFYCFRRSNDVGPVREILSHPHAIAQCRHFVEASGATVRTVDSTAKACEEVANASSPGMLAISAKSAGAIYGLNLVASSVEDHPGAGTKFYAVGRCYFPPSGRDKSLLVLIPTRHDTGLLVRTLSVFSSRGLDLLSIHSRPLRSTLGRYCFIVVVDGHLRAGKLREALRELVSVGTAVKFIGSFAVWSGMLPEAPFAAIEGATTDLAQLDNWIGPVCPD